MVVKYRHKEKGEIVKAVLYTGDITPLCFLDTCFYRSHNHEDYYINSYSSAGRENLKLNTFYYMREQSPCNPYSMDKEEFLLKFERVTPADEILKEAVKKYRHKETGEIIRAVLYTLVIDPLYCLVKDRFKSKDYSIVRYVYTEKFDDTIHTTKLQRFNDEFEEA